MEILNISWDSIPKEHHNHILGDLPMGSYIRSLPFKDAENYPVFKVPVRSELKAKVMLHPFDSSVCENEVLQFRRVSARKNYSDMVHHLPVEYAYIWRKVGG